MTDCEDRIARMKANREEMSAYWQSIEGEHANRLASLINGAGESIDPSTIRPIAELTRQSDIEQD